MVANMFGIVLPIQKGRWNCEQVNRLKNKAQPRPKRRVTPLLIKHNVQAFKLANTSRTTKNVTAMMTGQMKRTYLLSEGQIWTAQIPTLLRAILRVMKSKQAVDCQ